MRGRGLAALTPVSVLLGLLLMAGCSKQPEQKPGPPPVVIGVSVGYPGNETSKLVEKILREEGRRGETRVLFRDAGNDPEKQRQDIQKMLEQNKIKALVVRFIDPALGEELVPRLVEKQIKVVALEVLPPGVPLDGYVAAEYRRVGQLAASYIREMAAGDAPPGRQVVWLRGNPTDYHTVRLGEGLEEGLAGSGWGLEAHFQPHWDPGTVEKVLTAAPLDRLAAVVSAEGEAALAAARTLQRFGQDREVITVGVGGSKQAAQAISQGGHEAEVDTRPDMVVRVGLEAARDLVNSGSWDYEEQLSSGNYDIPARLVPVQVVDRSNLYLLESRWGKLPSEEKADKGTQNGSDGQEEGGSEGSGQGLSDASGQEGNKGSTVTIKTKQGKTMKIDVEGEIESIEVGGGEEQQQKQGGSGAEQ